MEDFVSDLCDKLDVLLTQETKIEEYRVEAELGNQQFDNAAVCIYS
jgi:hypothetical protein